MPSNSQIAQAETIVFPMTRRARDVREAAEVLNRTHGEAAVVYWKALVRSIADPLLAMGIADEEVRREIFAFQDSVQAELREMAEA